MGRSDVSKPGGGGGASSGGEFAGGGVYIKMTSNRYKRTEFEEGDGESIGGSSLDSVTAVNQAAGGGGGGGGGGSR